MLGPSLFNIAVRGIKRVPVSQSSRTICYSDDLLLVKAIDNEDDEDELQDETDAFVICREGAAQNQRF